MDNRETFCKTGGACDEEACKKINKVGTCDLPDCKENDE